MAKKIRIQNKTTTGDYVVVHPETESSIVLMNDGTNLEETTTQIQNNVLNVDRLSKENFEQISDIGTRIYIADSVSFSDGKIVLTIPDFQFKTGCQVTFVAPSSPSDNNVILINDVDYTVKTLSGATDLTDCWIEGSLITVSLKDGEAFVKIGNIGEQVPTEWEQFQLVTSSQIWKAPSKGWYRFHVVGKCGDGSNGISHSYFTNAVGGGGGGSGGWAIYDIYLNQNESIELTITNGITSLGDYCSSTSGTNAGSQNKGTGGIATGGNVANLNGGSGGNGGIPKNGGAIVSPESGELNGAKAGANCYAISGGGGGGAGYNRVDQPNQKYIGDITTYSGGNGGTNNRPLPTDATAYPEIIQPNGSVLLFGGGSGGGGNWNDENRWPAGKGSQGSPACIIIERGI